ncbi:MAG: hypothetical protein ACI3ZQ_00725 [Candidatus Cryptobacteroides sp.]
MNKVLFSDESRRFAGATIYIILAPDNRYKFDTGKSASLINDCGDISRLESRYRH